MKPLPLIVQVLRDPPVLARLSAADWDLLLRQADKSMLLAALGALVESHDLMGAIPAQARTHLDWIATLARRHRSGVQWEVEQIRKALAPLGMPVVLLKGAAYTMAGLPPGRGRLFSDIDILVPRARLDETESALRMHGWISAKQDAYDERYYRQWMHELPPMVHIQRKSAIDVHHAILPLTAAQHPDSAKLMGAAVALGGDSLYQVLAPADMVLHSAVHLFHDEFKHGLRDLLDLDRLLRHFGADPAFWDGLAARAAELELGRSLFYALRYAERLLGTPVPAAVIEAAATAAPGSLLLALMDQLFLRALLPQHPSCADAFSASARFALYLRANWLRMPPVLLARHLFHKAFLSPKQ